MYYIVTSIRGGRPCEEAFPAPHFNFSKAFTKVFERKIDRRYIKLDSLEDLLSFQIKHGMLLIKNVDFLKDEYATFEIEIYDDYRLRLNPKTQ